MPRSTKERIAGGAVLLLALLLLGIGAVRTHKAYDPGTADFGLVAFTRVSDRDLVIDATFGGVERRGGLLYSTYDRGEPRGKRSCPT